MLERITHEQFNEWIAKDIVEPIGRDGTNSILAKIGILISVFMGNKDITMQSFKHWEEDTEPEVSGDALFQSLEMAGGKRT